MNSIRASGNDANRRELLSRAAGVALAAPAWALARRAEANHARSDANQHSERGNGECHDPVESVLPTGRQFEITSHGKAAIITEVGAGLRSYQVNGVEVLGSFPETAVAPGGHGHLLLPFGGRVDGGQYTHLGVVQQLALTAPTISAAQHGLVRWSTWNVVCHSSHSITLGLMLHNQPGYPFVLQLRQHYEVTRAGLTATTFARNVGPTAAPFGVGNHPYFTAGTPTVNTSLLTIPAAKIIPRSGNTHPPGTVPIPAAGTVWDFRTPKPIGTIIANGTPVDFTEFERDAFGRASVTLTNPDTHRSVTVWMDSTRDYLVVFTGGTRAAIALEPHTHCNNAFNNGLGLRILQSGESIESRWGVEVA